MIGALCVLSLAVCCGLAFWQWQRFSSANGDLQNLGYVLLWPLFGLFPSFVVWRMRQLRAQQETEPVEPPAAEESPRRVPREMPVVAPEDDDPELAAYNRYLAQLHAADQQQETR